MKSTDLISMFLARADSFGCVGLSRKQTTWLLDTLNREHLLPERPSHHPINIKDSDGKYHKLAVYPNGAGFIKPA